MKRLQFKTSISCNSCIRAVTPFLNENKAISKWDVRTEDPDKVLTAYGEDLRPEDVMNAVRNAGYEIEPLDTSKTKDPQSDFS